jgi:hypothetical protein
MIVLFPLLHLNGKMLYYYEMVNLDSKNWFVCTISRQAPHNWEIAKQHGIWGIPSSGRNISLDQAKKDDMLLFYFASKGFFAAAELIGSMRKPISKEEAPWAGGVYRYGAIMPFKIKVELETPIIKPFVDNKIVGTSISTTALRKGFVRISNQDAQFIYGELSKIKKIK